MVQEQEPQTVDKYFGGVGDRSRVTVFAGFVFFGYAKYHAFLFGLLVLICQLNFVPVCFAVEQTTGTCQAWKAFEFSVNWTWKFRFRVFVEPNADV